VTRREHADVPLGCKPLERAHRRRQLFFEWAGAGRERLQRVHDQQIDAAQAWRVLLQSRHTAHVDRAEGRELWLQPTRDSLEVGARSIIEGASAKVIDAHAGLDGQCPFGSAREVHLP
jgi:redox-sensitive bicupin YhaK (pirin superfamily)